MDFALIATMAEDASRCPKKLMRHFDGSKSLADIFLGKFRHLVDSAMFAESAVIVPVWDVNLRAKVRSSGAHLLLQAAHYPPASGHDCFRPLVEVKADWIVWVNPCQPFLTETTVIHMVQQFIKQKPKAMTTVAKRKNAFWNLEDSTPVNNPDPTCISTKKMPPLGESTHSVHIFNRMQMLDAGVYWTYSGPDDPALYVLSNPREALDIDEEEEFADVEAAYLRTADRR